MHPLSFAKGTHEKRGNTDKTFHPSKAQLDVGNR
jgi:hypothetical protein